MALRLSHWLAVVTTLIVLVGAWRLPLGSVSPGGTPVQPSEAEERFDRLAGELRNARAVLDQLRRAASLPQRVTAEAAGVSVFVPPDAAVAPELLSRLRARLDAEAVGAFAGRASPAPSDGARATALAYGYDGRGGGETGLGVAQAYRLETYVGGLPEAPYCAQVVVTRPAQVDELVENDLEGRGWSRWTGGLLGPCAFYARHGPAGPRIQDWLEAGGIDFAFGRREGTGRSPDYSVPRRSVLGMYVISSLTVDRCLTGDAETCASVVLEARRPGRTARPAQDPVPASPAIFVGTPRGGPFPAQDWFLLYDLEQQFGPEAFRRFWTSDADVRAAFQSAFGIDLGEWLIDWLEDAGPGIDRATPAPTPSATLGGLLVVSLMTGLATFWQRRRQVG